MQIARISGLIILKEFPTIRGGKVSWITELWKLSEIHLNSVKRSLVKICIIFNNFEY